jgi:YD repeat-containing protein
MECFFGNTVYFCFGRPIQVKKESMVDGAPKMIVSGLARYDAFGRVKETFYPVVEDLTNKTIFNTAFDNSVPPTITTYDILDRVTKTRLPDDTETNFVYSIMDGLLKTTVIDAKNNKQETFANGSGLTVKSLQYKHIDPDTVLTTLFEYDDVNQLKKVTDDAGKSTESFYDWAGNRTQVKHPASGTTTFGYDPAGNTLWKYTANKDSILLGMSITG